MSVSIVSGTNNALPDLEKSKSLASPATDGADGVATGKPVTVSDIVQDNRVRADAPAPTSNQSLSLTGSDSETAEKTVFEKLFGPLEFKVVADEPRTIITDAVESYQTLNSYSLASARPFVSI